MSTRMIIYPNHGVGNFFVGQQLSHCVKKMQSFGNDIEFRYGKLNLIIVCNKTLGISLYFDTFLQRLLFIKINVITKILKYAYQSNIITQFTFKNVYNRYFGPTFEGEYDPNDQKYYLSYCGISFMFTDIDESTNSNEKLNTCDSDKFCSSIFIYRHDKKESWLNYSKELFANLNESFDASYMERMNKIFLTDDESLTIKNVTLSFYDQHNLCFDMRRKGDPLTVTISIGTTSMHSIIRMFGFPDNTVCKRKKRTNLTRHKKISCSTEGCSFESTRNYMPISIIDNLQNTKNLISPKGVPCDLITCEEESIVIHNYFNFGFDIVYDLNASLNGSGLVSRVILHQNSIESTEFLRYNKVPVLYKISSNRQAISLKTLSDVREVITLTNLPVFIDRKEYHVSESSNKDEDFEIIDPISPDTNEKLKHWGLSNYDGCEFAIWESLLSNDEISCITVLESKSAS